jgi:tripartite-type tricarboxylate transporter receptor subunit TctC
MNTPRPSFEAAVLALGTMAAVVGSPANADSYPTRPVMILSQASAGSGPDVIARIVADRLTQAFGQQVLVINRPGGGGVIAAQAAAAAPSDGHTLYVPLASTFVVLPETQAKMPLDLARDLVSIGLIGEQPMVIAVNPALGINTLAELIARAKGRPGEILCGGAGRGTLPHLTSEMLRGRFGIDLTYIPSSSMRAMQDAIGGTIHVFIESMAAVSGPMQGGSLQALAVASSSRLPDFPDLPTVEEAAPGVGNFEARGWFPLMAPARTPDAIVQKVNRDLRSALDEPEVRRKLATLGTYPRPMSPAETAAFIRNEQDLWRPVVKQLDLVSQ